MPPDRKNDIYIMDWVCQRREQFKDRDIQIINYCRQYLHITTVSELFDPPCHAQQNNQAKHYGLQLDPGYPIRQCHRNRQRCGTRRRLIAKGRNLGASCWGHSLVPSIYIFEYLPTRINQMRGNTQRNSDNTSTSVSIQRTILQPDFETGLDITRVTI
jgi:hypothetical protein